MERLPQGKKKKEEEEVKRQSYSVNSAEVLRD